MTQDWTIAVSNCIFPLFTWTLLFSSLIVFKEKNKLTKCRNLKCFLKRFEKALLKKTFRVLLTHLSFKKLVCASSIYEMRYFSSFSELDFHPFLQILHLMLCAFTYESTKIYKFAYTYILPGEKRIIIWYIKWNCFFD